jgi:hypothetical protein
MSTARCARTISNDLHVLERLMAKFKREGRELRVLRSLGFRAERVDSASGGKRGETDTLEQDDG